MQDSGQIVYLIPLEELIRVTTRRVVLRRRYLESVALFALLGGLLLIVGPAFYSASALLLLYAVSRPFVFRHLAAKSLSRQPGIGDRKTLTFNANGVEVVGSDWLVRRGWRHFKGWNMDERYFYLDTTPSGIAFMIPRSAMSEAQQELLRGHLKAVPPAPR